MGRLSSYQSDAWCPCDHWASLQLVVGSVSFSSLLLCHADQLKALMFNNPVVHDAAFCMTGSLGFPLLCPSSWQSVLPSCREAGHLPCPPTCCVILGKRLSFSEPQFPHQQNGENDLQRDDSDDEMRSLLAFVFIQQLLLLSTYYVLELCQALAIQQ